jgi:hypothetical protein
MLEAYLIAISLAGLIVLILYLGSKRNNNKKPGK